MIISCNDLCQYIIKTERVREKILFLISLVEINLNIGLSCFWFIWIPNIPLSITFPHSLVVCACDIILWKFSIYVSLNTLHGSGGRNKHAKNNEQDSKDQRTLLFIVPRFNVSLHYAQSWVRKKNRICLEIYQIFTSYFKCCKRKLKSLLYYILE